MYNFLKKPGRLKMDNPERAKLCAFEILKDFGIDSAPVDPAKIARELSLIVNFAEFPGNDEVLGFYNSKESAIYVNLNQAATGMAFTIAHELGHHKLHQEEIKNGRYKILYRNQNLDETDPLEKEANIFAANFLVPKFLLDKYCIQQLLKNSLIERLDIATLFAVSPQIINMRLKDEYGL